MMAAWKAAPALASGNSLIIKPAELTSLSTLRMAELAAEAGIPDGVLSVVPGLGETAGQAIGRHMDVDVLSFTGSTEVGRMFLRYASESNLKEIVLEGGGERPQGGMGPPPGPAYLAGQGVGAGLLNMGGNSPPRFRPVCPPAGRAPLVRRL